MQTNNSSDAEMERLSMRLDQMESWEIARFVLVTAVRLFSIFSCAAMIKFVLKHRPIRNKVNALLVNLCLVIIANLIYCTAYQFFRWKNTLLPEEIFQLVTFLYYILYTSLITAITILPTFWFLFLNLKNLFQNFDKLILIGLLPPYLIPSIFTVLFWDFNQLNLHKFYYYFILYYSVSLLLTLTILLYFIMLKLEERLNKNKLDYLLHLGTSFSISLFPEVLCFTFELYFFDEKGPLYYKIYYVDFGVDLTKCVVPLVLFTWLVVSNKYFRKACRRVFARKNFERIFHVNKENNEKTNEFDTEMDFNEVFL
ncbi:uncharacterized protein LOC123313485 [Coccinella septempunctata]|uniref:uncharacterized protein LOC123313485 n=1 Tax=Coccinella septempunctata TaxID=41139 RepID=UPI001D085696|nr:uncharacterized protein LOC123313485 [Coccinella septempunctata]